jgi:uncharacterized protein YjiK
MLSKGLKSDQPAEGKNPTAGAFNIGRLKALVWIGCLLLVGRGVAQDEEYFFPYRLDAPDTVLSLAQEELREISGLSATPKKGMLCAVSDERGEIFFIDAATGAVLQRALFREKGDFEGVEMVQNRLYAVRSNGQLYEIEGWRRRKPRVKCYETPLTKRDDVEGLAYDPNRRALLLACKGIPDSAHERCIYAFDLLGKSLIETPVYRIDPHQINEQVPYAEGEKQHFFSPSGIAIHPSMREIFILSTSLKRLVVLDYSTGSLRYVTRLERDVMPQPEGIAFDAEGRLFIASEGKKGKGLLLCFSPRSTPAEKR